VFVLLLCDDEDLGDSACDARDDSDRRRAARDGYETPFHVTVY
jgi:hypothetical protein